jgi:hypothetical protein
MEADIIRVDRVEPIQLLRDLICIKVIYYLVIIYLKVYWLRWHYFVSKKFLITEVE